MRVEQKFKTMKEEENHPHLSIVLEPGDTADQTIGVLIGNCCWDIDWTALSDEERLHIEQRMKESFCGVTPKPVEE